LGFGRPKEGGVTPYRGEKNEQRYKPEGKPKEIQEEGWSDNESPRFENGCVPPSLSRVMLTTVQSALIV